MNEEFHTEANESNDTGGDCEANNEDSEAPVIKRIRLEGCHQTRNARRHDDGRKARECENCHDRLTIDMSRRLQQKR
jgi:hypothetical protein